MSTGFTPILVQLVESVPGATGAIFADDLGEVIDAHPKSDELLVLGAQVGVLYALSQAAMGLFHYGYVEAMVLSHSVTDVVVRGVAQGTYVVVTAPSPVPLAHAMRAIDRAAADLAVEMG